MQPFIWFKHQYKQRHYLNLIHYYLNIMKSIENAKITHVKKSLGKLFSFALTVALSPLFFACNSDSEGDINHEIQEDAKPIELRLMAKVETDNDFALDLLKATYKFDDKDNIFISPLSVSMALSMTLNGAKGATLDEMKEALRAKGYSANEINEYNKSLKKALLEVDNSTEIAIANSIWYRNSYTVKNDFITVNKDNYDAEIKAIDFNSPNAVTQINGWCAEHTKDKITEIIQEISSDEIMYLINAIYFKGIWKSRFDKKNTNKEDFFSENKSSSGKVDMMNQTGAFDYFADDNCQYIRLPYGNKAFSMVVILPDEVKTVNDIISNLDSEQWNNAMENMREHEVNLSFPRFKTECEYKMRKSILPEMGMITPFIGGLADFSGIMDISIYISQVIHKTFVEVNEEGTEAAAVTAVIMKGYSMLPTKSINFKVNKPFVFAIRENSTGVILFIGKMGKI